MSDKSLSRSRDLSSLVFVLMMTGYYMKWQILCHIAIVLVLCSAFYLVKAIRNGAEGGKGKYILQAIVLIMWIVIYAIDVSVFYNL